MNNSAPIFPHAGGLPGQQQCLASENADGRISRHRWRRNGEDGESGVFSISMASILRSGSDVPGCVKVSVRQLAPDGAKVGFLKWLLCSEIVAAGPGPHTKAS